MRDLLDAKHNEAFVERLDTCARSGEATSALRAPLPPVRRRVGERQRQRGAAAGQQGPVARRRRGRRRHHAGRAADVDPVPLRDARDRRGGAQVEGECAAGRDTPAGVHPVLGHPELHGDQRAVPARADRGVPQRLLQAHGAGDLRRAGHARQVHRRRHHGGVRRAHQPPRRSAARGAGGARHAARPAPLQRASSASAARSRSRSASASATASRSPATSAPSSAWSTR